ncbi:MAG: hypothetical protein PF637_06075 [Spirochaetes bacterium]|jgi:hypothetical protein|nr:hypothetical protein [Spirochaetota bacterium]
MYNRKSKMAYWKLFIAGEEVTRLIGKYITGIDITYELKRPTDCRVGIKSRSFFEDLCSEGLGVDVFFGDSPVALVKMFSGKISKRPEGSAQETIDYNIMAVENTAKMAMKQKRRVFASPTKAGIIQQIVAENGYVGQITISDSMPIDAKEMPVQNNQTDLAFLYECADKWDCLMWTVGEKLYFVDSSKAFLYGNTDRIRSVQDYRNEYLLGYRTDAWNNNVQSVTYKHKISKGGGAGSPGASGGSERKAVTNKPEDFEITYMGGVYKLKPSVVNAIKNNSEEARKIYAIISKAGAKNFEEHTLREYYYPVTAESRTNKGGKMGSHSSGYAKHGNTLNIKLNTWDVRLRPPREALFKSGSNDPKADSADLPAYLFKTNPQKYSITKVKTGLGSTPYTEIEAVM